MQFGKNYFTWWMLNNFGTFLSMEKNKKQNLEDISKPKYNLVEEKINPVSSMLQPPYTFTLCMLYVYSKKLFGCRW